VILLFCDGDVLEARNVGPVKVRLKRRSGGIPLKPSGGYQLLDDDVASAKLRELVHSGFYDGGKI
jgi:hypothetical protein